MSPALVFRIEHPDDGCGPWTGQYVSGLNATRMPAPYADDAVRPDEVDVNTDYYCGLATLDSLYYWFNPGDRNRLSKRGFVLASYLVPPNAISPGRVQVLFRRKDSHFLGYAPLGADEVS